MNLYGNGRDPYYRDGPSRPSDSRARSRSPPRPYIDRSKPSARIPRRDPDAPAETLPRKPPGLPGNAAQANASSLDRNAATIRPDPSSARRDSAPFAAIEDPTKLAEQLYALPVERGIFDQIEQKRFSITELRRDLNDQQKKLKSIQDLVNKAGNQHMARLTQQQQTVADLERQIRSESDDLYAMNIQWQVRLVPSLFAAASAPFEAKLQDLSQGVKSERDQDRKREQEFRDKASPYFGQIKAFQGDLSRLKSDLSALTKDNDRLRNDLSTKHKDLRKDLDADVSHIKDSRERIKRLEKDLAAMQDRSAKPSAAPSSAVANSVRAVSTAPSSPGPAHAPQSHATSSAQDPRPRPAAQSNTASATASPLAATATQTTAQNAAADASSSARPSEPVTRAQFRKWLRDFLQDLELRLDEHKDLTVQEATAEINACMDDRLRFLARKWKNRVLQEGATATNPSTEAAANADGTTPMEVDNASGQNPAAQQAATANGTQTATATTVQTNQHMSLAQPNSQPDSARSEERAAPTVTPQAMPAGGSASEAPKSNTNDVSATQSAIVSPPTTPPVDGTAQASVVKHNGSGKEFVVFPKETLKGIRTTLKDHDTQIATIKQEIDALRSTSQNDSFDTSFNKLIRSSHHIKQLLDALHENGLGEFATTLRDTVAHLQPSVVQMRTDLDALRTLQPAVQEQIQALQEWKEQFIAAVQGREDWLQKQIEALDDQSSLQGALLVTLCEHANPRRLAISPAPASARAITQGSPGVQSPAVRSPLAQNAQHPPSSAGAVNVPRQAPQHVSTLADAFRPQAGVDAAATALSAHMQPPIYTNHVQPYQQVPQQQQHQPHPQHSPYSVPRPAYQYQDPNQRQGYH